jgi:hypothetical protein
VLSVFTYAFPLPFAGEGTPPRPENALIAVWRKVTGEYTAADCCSLFAARSEHDPEKACPGLDPGWKLVFGNDHAEAKSQSGIRIRRKVIPL